MAQAPTEAPAGFDTPAVIAKPGSESVSNGIVEPPGDTFQLDQQIFELQHDASDGLGPVFNGRACAECHQNPVTGGTSQFTELRAGHLDAHGNFVNATVTINDGAATIANRSIINDRALGPEAQEHVPVTETHQAKRAVLPMLGDGFVEAVTDVTLQTISAGQPALSHGFIRGEVVKVPILEAPGKTMIGRFGWKDQDPTVLSFAGDAYLNEMGVTNHLRPTDITTVDKTTADPEDVPDSIGLANVDHFAQFIRGLKVPPRDEALAATPAAQAGQLVFEKIGCAICHVESMVTAPAGTVINAGTYTVPDAIGNKIIHPYGDFLLHDVGTGDGIVQGGPPDTINKLRTMPLWGLRERPRYMHDHESLNLEAAILRHQGEAIIVTDTFASLGGDQQQELIAFLNSL
jgi:CxxC motif-containing protein (DUF1111 family)